jgi:hypothetical protein
MPLVQLITDLKSLKYGKDTPGGGYSGQPYIQAKIPDGLEPKSTDFILRGGYLTVGDSLTDIKRLTKMFFDLKSPNGLFFIAKQNVLSNSAVRTQTSGVLNEGIYTPLNTLAEAGVVAFGGHLNKQGINPFKQTGAYTLDNESLYSVKVKSFQPIEENRLAQILKGINENRVTSLEGFKFNEGGVNVLSYKGGPGAPLGVGNTNIRFSTIRTGEASGINFKQYQVGIGGSNTIRTNIPNYILNLSSSFAGTGLTIPLSSEGISPFVLNNQLITNVIPEEQWKTYQASGYPLHEGPSFNRLNLPYILSSGSSTTYENLAIRAGVSIGNAKINNDFDHTQVNVYTQGNTWPETNNDLVYANNTFTYNQIDLINTPDNTSKINGSPKIQDFRTVLRTRLGGFKNKNGRTSSEVGATPLSLDYQTLNIEKRVNIGGADGLGPGARANNDYSSYTAGVVGPGRSGRALDIINAFPIYTSETGPETTQLTNDLISFRIGAINNSNPTIVSYMHFRAFIDSFSDSYTGDWSGYNYLGRGEKFYTYNGFDRKISLSFKAAAQSKEELIPMYKKLNFLASNLAPDYSGEYGYMKGCFITLTVGGYLYEQPGFITNLSYDMITEMPWEIGINDTDGAQDPTVKQLSHMVKVNSFDFTPIHNFIPQKQSIGVVGNSREQDGREEYIALANPNDGSTNWAAGESVNQYFKSVSNL